MRWLRSKPLDINEIDESRIWHAKYGGDADGDAATPVVVGMAAEGNGEDAVMMGGTAGPSQQQVPPQGVSVVAQGATTVNGRRKAPMRRSRGRGRAGEAAVGTGGVG